MARIAVLGSTTWGTTLAVLFAKRGHETVLITRGAEEAEELSSRRENRRRLPGVRFPEELRLSADPQQIREAEVLVLAVPSASMLQNLRTLSSLMPAEITVVSASKGIEPSSGARMSELVAAAGVGEDNVLALSGPNFAAEISAGLPAATVVAGRSQDRAQEVQGYLGSDRFRVYRGDDIEGVEIGGALKNVAAIACGISDGLALGENAKAALTTRALAEITRLGLAVGAKAHTFLGLAGLGDLMLSCTSDLSRNRRLGLELAKGVSLADALGRIGGVSEGAQTALGIPALSAKHSVEMPISQALHDVLYAGLGPEEAMTRLMAREQKAE